MPDRIDPEKLGKFVGNIVNGMPEYPSQEDIDIAKEAAKIGVIDALADFDEVVVPEEDAWGLPGGDQ